jgi:hypothetical protein
MNLRPALPHQAIALASPQLENDYAGLFMDMRLGKSLVLLRWLKMKEATNTLLVAPDLPLADWESECEREEVAFERIRGTKKKRLERVEYWKRRILDAVYTYGYIPFVVAVTYETLRVTPELLELPWDCVALDESTHIKNPKAAITKLLLRKCSNFHNRAVLAGLPRPQGPMEIFTQMQFLLGGSFMGHSNFWKWRDRFFFQAGYEFLPRKGAMQAIKDATHEHAVVMTKAEAGITRHVERKTLRAPLDKKANDLQNKIVTDWAAEDYSTLYAPVKSGWLERLAGGHDPNWNRIPCWKYDALVEFLEELGDEQAVIWARFNKEQERAYEVLNDKGWTAEVLNGSVVPEHRKSVLNRFRGGKIQYLICQPILVRYGVDLANADVSIYLSSDYSHLTRRQSEERTSHPMKKKPTLIVDFISEGSADEIVHEALRDMKADASWFMNRVKLKLGRKK